MMDRAEIDRAVQAFDKLKLYEMKMRRRSSPAFIGIGPGRAGTTSLFRFLQKHPQVSLPAVKEINYFGFRSRGEGARPWGMTFDEYQTYFTGAQVGQVSGEISPAYFILPGALREIKANIPDCKIITGLRDPLERLLSHYKYHRKHHGFESFDDFIAHARNEIHLINEPRYAFQWFKPVRILASSLYADTITACLELFGRESLCIYRFEDFISDPQCAVDIQQFLGLEPQAIDVVQSNASTPALDCELSEENKNWLYTLFANDLSRTESLTGMDLASYKIRYGQSESL